MIKGLGFGNNGSELNEELRENSSDRSNSDRSALSGGGMLAERGLRASPISEMEEKNLEVRRNG